MRVYAPSALSNKLPMSDADPANPDLQFECPLCDGAFEVSAEWLGHEVECPHCGEAVSLATDDPSEVQPADEPVTAKSDPPAPNPFAAPQQPLAASETAGPSAPDAQPPKSEPPKAAPAPKAERLPLSLEQKAALRRRLNLFLAIAGAVVLATTFVVLSWLAS